MQGKKYAVFSRFSVHTACVTHLIKNLYFFKKICYTLYKSKCENSLF